MKSELSPKLTINSKLFCFKNGGVAKFQRAGKLLIVSKFIFDNEKD